VLENSTAELSLFGTAYHSMLLVTIVTLVVYISERLYPRTGVYIQK